MNKTCLTCSLKKPYLNKVDKNVCEYVYYLDFQSIIAEVNNIEI